MTTSPRELIEKIITANPKADRDEVAAIMWKTVSRDKGFLRPLFEDWMAQNFHRFAKAKRQTHTSLALKERMKKALMTHLLSGGLLLRDATGADCAAEGGWLAELAKMVKPYEVIGKALTTEQIWDVRAKHVTEKIPNVRKVT